MMRRTPGLLVAVCFATLFAGCQSTPRPEESKGLPKTAKLIGGGPGFVYGVPSDGRIYVVYGDKVEKIQNVRGGDRFYSIGPVEHEEEIKDYTKYQYYFEPVKMADK